MQEEVLSKSWYCQKGGRGYIPYQDFLVDLILCTEANQKDRIMDPPYTVVNNPVQTSAYTSVNNGDC